jgi:hypothetical protein
MSIPQQTNIEVSNQAIHYWASSPLLSATARLQLARYHQDQYDWLDSEFANLRGCHSWLASQNGPGEVHTLGHLGVAFRDEWQSLLIYQRLGVLSRQRMVNMLRELLTWAVGRR